MSYHVLYWFNLQCFSVPFLNAYPALLTLLLHYCPMCHCALQVSHTVYYSYIFSLSYTYELLSLNDSYIVSLSYIYELLSLNIFITFSSTCLVAGHSDITFVSALLQLNLSWSLLLFACLFSFSVNICVVHACIVVLFFFLFVTDCTLLNKFSHMSCS